MLPGHEARERYNIWKDGIRIGAFYGFCAGFLLAMLVVWIARVI